MALFAENRKHQNRGCGVKFGHWLFNEFMFDDSVFGRAVVAYNFRAWKVGGEPATCRVEFIRVKEIEIFDDDGNSLPIPEENRDALEQQVRDEFTNQIEAVIEHETRLL